MFLFIFAFFGNVFYVMSILVAPQMRTPEAGNYIRESIPYAPLRFIERLFMINRFLLGSGGTLMFDMTIVTQSYLYRPKIFPRRSHSTHIRHPYSAHEEESAGLLSGDALASSSTASLHHPTGALGRGVGRGRQLDAQNVAPASRSRSRTSVHV